MSRCENTRRSSRPHSLFKFSSRRRFRTSIRSTPMKTDKLVWLALAFLFTRLAGLISGFSISQEQKVGSGIYELRTYTTLPGRLPALHKRFSEHTMKLVEQL